MQHSFRVTPVELLEIYLRVAAFPGGEYLEVRPEMLREHLRVFRLEFTQFLRTLRIGFEIWLEGLPYVIGDAHFI